MLGPIILIQLFQNTDYYFLFFFRITMPNEESNHKENAASNKEKEKKHDSGAADLEKVTDYAEEKEIGSSSAAEDAIAVISKFHVKTRQGSYQLNVYNASINFLKFRFKYYETFLIMKPTISCIVSSSSTPSAD